MRTVIITAAFLISFNWLNAQNYTTPNVPDTTVETTNSFVDMRDNRTYQIVKIGEQIWMAENLDYKTDKYSYCYGRKSTNCDKYGRLYRWEAAKNACPEGWHLPTDEEWIALEKALGMPEADVSKSNTWRGTNQGVQLMKDTSIGFNAVLGGYFNPPSNYFLGGMQAFYWTATEKGGLAWYRQLYKDSKQVFRNIRAKSWGMSVRCVKDK
ncbi:MAG: hypothetical protein L3J74_03225 [Bacteroidales bacterium]|nr:hypothetical protein [Bacteroidales bacterium]